MSEKGKNEKEILIIPCAGTERLTGRLTAAVIEKILKDVKDINLQVSPSLAQIAANVADLGQIHKKGGGGPIIIAFNGCPSLCVNRVLTKAGIKPKGIINISELIRDGGFPKGARFVSEIEDSGYLDLLSKSVLEKIDGFISGKSSTVSANESGQKRLPGGQEFSEFEFKPSFIKMLEFTYGKFTFKVPVAANKGVLYFNWNDAWAYILNDDDLRSGDFAASHTPESGGNVFAVIGISDYMQQNLSDILMVELPEVGSVIEQFEAIATLESTKSVAEVLTPFTGKVITVNRELEDSPELINLDPYGKGWIAIIELENLKEEVENLQGAQEYFEEMKQKIIEEGVH